MAIATVASPYINRVYAHYTEKWGEARPEARLPHLVLLSWLIPVGLFWFAWTSTPSIHWASCIVAGVPFGIGFVTLFLGITSYLIDCYGRYSASALAANAILRALFGAAAKCMTHWGQLGRPRFWASLPWPWPPCRTYSSGLARASELGRGSIRGRSKKKGCR